MSKHQLPKKDYAAWSEYARNLRTRGPLRGLQNWYPYSNTLIYSTLLLFPKL